jgi:multimeric flavodoxin WrbA
VAKTIVVFHSGMGHTVAVAKAARDGAASVPGMAAELVYVTDAPQRWADFESADAIIFGCPTYMGSASGPFKNFMDATSGIWARLGWRGKVAAGFTSSGNQSGDKLATLIQLAVFAMQHGMIWVGLDLPGGNNSSRGNASDLNRLGSWLGAMAQANMDQGVEGIPDSDLRTALRLGARTAEVTLDLLAGRAARATPARPVADAAQ